VASPASLSADEARRLALWAQGVLGAPERRAGVEGVLHRLGAVQLDTISVLARSHELVAYARLGAVGRSTVEAAYWGRPPRAFEYWDHAACVLPLEVWPAFAFRRRHWQARDDWGTAGPVRDRVLARLAAEGPLTATDLGGAKKGGPWWDWSDVKLAVEHLLREGTVTCVERRGWRRVYDLAERAVPDHLRAIDLSDEECLTALVASAGRRLGVATTRDLAEHHHLRLRDATGSPAGSLGAEGVVASSGLVPVAVDGWPSPAWADPAALAVLDAGGPRGRHRTTLLSPFDSLVWDRARTQRVFGFTHSLEAYVPAPKRVHGYFAMPLLAGGRLLGRVDPSRQGRTLVARRLSIASRSRAAVAAMAAALAEAASWVGCDSVGLERVDPPELAEPLRAALP